MPSEGTTQVDDAAAPAASKTKMYAALALLAVVIGAIVVYLVFFKKEKKPADAPTTGTSAEDKKTKTVELSRTPAVSSPSADQYYLNIAELALFNGETRYDLNAEGSATASSVFQATAFPASNLTDMKTETFFHSSGDDLNPKITYTFTNPMPVTKVTVYNRQDCCWDRTNGVKLVVKNAAGKVLLDATLSGSKDPQSFTVPT